MGGGSSVVLNANNIFLTKPSPTSPQVSYVGGSSSLSYNARGKFEADGFLRTDGGDLSIKAKDISIKNSGGQAAIATYGRAARTSVVNLEAETIFIQAEGTRNADGKASGPACAIEMAPVGEEFTSSVILNASKELTLVGDIRTNYFDNANSGQKGTSKLIIGSPDSAATTKIIGDIYNGATEHAQDTGRDSTIEINLTGKDSSITGAIRDGNLEYAKSDAESVKGITVNLEDGASWTATKESIVNKVNSDGGVISTPGNHVKINELAVGDAGAEIRTSSTEAKQVEIAKSTGKGLKVVLESKGTDELTGSADSDSKTLSSLVSIGSADSGYTVEAEEGTVIGASTLTVGTDGSLSYTEQANSVTQGLQDIAKANFLAVRTQMNDLQKRMGDLRSMPAASGAWVRYFGGQHKYGSSTGLRNTYNTVQLGADARINGNFVLGGTFAYTDDDGHLKNGSSDGKQYSFGVYGSWLGDNGEFVDVIAKRTRVSTDFSLTNQSGLTQSAGYHNWANSISVEVGHRFSDIGATGIFLEPQAEFSYGFLTSAKYRTSAGAEVKQDSVKSAVGRLGLAAGYVFPEKAGSAYVRASVLHDFAGDASTTMSYKQQSRTVKDDLGGTWGEFAAGLTYNLTDRWSAYGEVQTTCGSPITNPWQVSAGVRMSF